MAAADSISGSRSDRVILYCSHGYPNDAIGPVQYLWRRPDGIVGQRQLWLLVHPAITDLLIKEINDNIKTLTNDSVMVTNLRDELVHYRVIGACCNDVITRAVDPVWSTDDGGEGDRRKWWLTGDDDGLTDKKKFFDYLCRTKSPTQFPNKVVLGLTVKDFHLSIPDKKLIFTSLDDGIPTNSCHVPGIVTPKLSHCHIWNKTIREQVKQAQTAEHKVNEMKSDKLSGVSEGLEKLECHIPLLLLHQTVNGVGVGWDILVPAGWGKPLWLNLVYNGARVVGYEEMKHYHLEQSVLHYPTDFPDTDAGRQLELSNLKMLQSRYCRYPPDKRPNFGKLNSSSPFLPAWGLVIGYHGDTGEELPAAKKAKLSVENSNVMEDEIAYYVLRSVKCLVSLSKLLDSLRAVEEAVGTEERWLSLINDIPELSTVTMDHPRSLVAISFTMCHRGNPSARSMLCIPSAEDLVKLSRDSGYYGPVESLNKKGVCLLHNQQLVIGTTSLTNKQFKMAKRQLQSQPNGEDFSYHGILSDNISTTLGVQPLQTSRPVIGYTTNAAYVFSQGMTSGVGFCSLLGLMKLVKFCYLQNHPVTILVREHDSLQYRFANVEIIQNHV